METVQIIGQRQDISTQEAYKSLRTNILFCGVDTKVIAVTSCEPNEGKTTTSFSLAESLAANGKRVVYVDADLRGSVFMSRFKVAGCTCGLSHYLSGQKKVDEVVYLSNLKNLCVITSGPVPPNPAELLGSRRFEELVRILRENFDYIIIDTPPLGNVIDCAVVSPCCDGIVLVISSGKISAKFAQNVKQQIEKTGKPFLGVVLNKVNVSSIRNTYYGKHYGKYYGHEKG